MDPIIVTGRVTEVRTLSGTQIRVVTANDQLLLVTLTPAMLDWGEYDSVSKTADVEVVQADFSALRSCLSSSPTHVSITLRLEGSCRFLTVKDFSSNLLPGPIATSLGDVGPRLHRSNDGSATGQHLV
jgi:hypothetical protein